MNWIVDEFGVVMPEMLCVFWKFVMFAAVGAFDLFAKKAVSALAYAVSPAIVLS